HNGACVRELYLDYVQVQDTTPPPPPSDSTPPTVSIATPASGATVSGVVSIGAAASDNVGVAKVEFYIDSTLVSTVTASPYNYSWNTATVANGSHALTAKAYDAAGNSTTSSAVNISVNNTSVDLMARNDFIYGTEIGAWATSGTPTVTVSSGIPGLIQAAKIPVVRFALYDCFSGMTCGTDNHAGTQSRTNFDNAINGITTNLLAEPWLKLVPIAPDTIQTINGTVFCPPTSNLALNLPFYKAVVDQAGNRVHIYESNNEMEYSCYKAWGYAGSGSDGVSTTIGNHFAQNMPALKKYARTKGIDIKTVGYIGVSGGTGWGNACTSPRLKAIDEFNTAVHTAYVNSGNDADYIPDGESVHAYPHSPDFGTSSDNCIFQYFKLFNQQWRQELVNIWGPTIGNQIKLSISEWNAGNTAWTGWSTPSTVQAFYDGWFKYVLQGQALPDGSVGATSRYWSANLFEAATDGFPYDFIKSDGTVQPWYNNFKSASLNDLNR
ncbi:MAG TPA: Ig-like domain-containing protein, partial [Patescibacteria group bacterium]|nr:Ig-like domain-containing protein [Patescibacteria group bacterium]